MDVMQLKTLQDWVVERRLRIVPGVSDVLVLGGKTKEFQAEIDLNRMMAHGLTLPQIITAISSRQLQRRRPHDRDRRTVGQRARHRRRRHAGGYRQHRAQPAGRRAGAALRRCQGPDRLHAAARHRRARRDDRYRHRHRPDAEVRTHDGGGAARPRRGRTHQQRRQPAVRECGSSRSTTAATWSRSPCSTVLAQHALRHRPDLPHPVGIPGRSALRPDRVGDHPGRVVPGRDRSRYCAGSPPICSRSARSISASSSMRPSS